MELKYWHQFSDLARLVNDGVYTEEEAEELAIEVLEDLYNDRHS